MEPISAHYRGYARFLGAHPDLGASGFGGGCQCMYMPRVAVELGEKGLWVATAAISRIADARDSGNDVTPEEVQCS